MSSPSSTEIVKNRFLGFLIWQLIPSSIIFLFTLIFILPFFFRAPFPPFLITIFSFLTFHLSILLFSIILHTISSTQPEHTSSLAELVISPVRFLIKWVVGGGSPELFNPNFRRRVKTSLSFLLFIFASAVAGSLSLVSLCWNPERLDGQRLIEQGMRGVLFGFLYGIYYVYHQLYVLHFPVIQRTPFFSFKMGIPSAVGQALKLSSVSFLYSAYLMVFHPSSFKAISMRQFIGKEIIFCVECYAVLLCWKLCHHLHEVLHTKRCVFAPSKGSAAAETNPSEPLLAALEESIPRSLLQYLAYLDLCMVCESNVDLWRRAAFFEETGETYKRVVTVCLRPLEQLTSNLGDDLEGFLDMNNQLSHQLRSPTDTCSDGKLQESFNDLQLFVWCTRTLAALTARSHEDDRFGVAQLSGCNASVISTLLSCLLAVESCMGKKTSFQAPHLMGAGNIKWAALSTGRRTSSPGIVGIKKRSGPLHAKAYAMADMLRTSIYNIVSVFHDEMVASAKAGALEKDWIVNSKPLYGTREVLVQKLGIFLDFRAN